MFACARSRRVIARVAALAALAVLACQMAAAQQTANGCTAPLNWTAAQDHQNMMDQLGIKALRPGPSGNEKAADHANYDESKANPFPDLPDALTSKNGQRVTTASQWWDRRRPEIVDDFEREVLGRIPSGVPRVTWKITGTADSKTGVFPVVEKQLVGHVENSSCPAVTVDIQMTLVTPANAKGPLPVMMMFGSATFLKRMADMFASRPELKKALGTDPPSTEQLIAGGWGYALIDPGSIQPDNGAGLTKGIIGLTNKGQPRKPEDWGALRAWAWRGGSWPRPPSPWPWTAATAPSTCWSCAAT